MNTKHADGEGPLVVVYDDACVFCQRAIAAIRVRDRQRQFRYVPRSASGLAKQYPGLALENFDSGMRVVDPNGNVHIGSDAIYLIGTKLPRFRWFAWMYRLPLINTVTRGVYSWIAAHRLQLSRHCSSDCKLDAGEEGASVTPFRCQLSRGQVLISVVILLIFGLHAWANLAKAVMPSSVMGDRSWPFLAYGMYRKSYSPDVIRATKQTIFAVTASGEELRMRPGIAGLHGQSLGRHYIGPMRAGDRSAAKRLAERVNVGHTDPIVAFRVQSDSYAMSGSGIVLERSQSMTYPVGN